MKNKVKGFTLIEIMIVIAIVAILASVFMGAMNNSKLKKACVADGGVWEKYLTGEIRDGNSVKDYRCVKKVKKPVAKYSTEGIVDSSKVKESEDYKKWILKVEGCPRAESRLKTYMYSGDTITQSQADDIEKILIDVCQQKL